jgi:hypothetical protein
MGRYKTIFGIAAALILILGILAYTQLEIYQRTEPVAPSRAIRTNPFSTLEKWLSKTGHLVRIDPRLSPSRLVLVKERSVYIQASIFDWQDYESTILPWVEKGGSLIISIDPPWYDEDENLTSFLEAVGVRAESAGGTDGDAAIDDGAGEDEPGAVPESAVILRDTAGDINFDPRFRFSLIEDFDGGVPLLMKDSQGITRLVQIPLGQGDITVTGRPYFMYNFNLKSEENARLSWKLTAAKTKGENSGVLFVRGGRVAKSLFGKLAERGNLLPLIVSVLALVFIGFWMVIPSFGVLRTGDGRRQRPIRDRFRSEARFLKKYHALDGYLEVYLREIKNRRHHPYHRDRHQCQQDRGKDLFTVEIEEIERSLSGASGIDGGAGGMDYKRKHLRYGEIIRNLKILETIMEQL